MKKQAHDTPKELARKAGNALRRAARNAHRIAAAYGTPIYVERNGKIIALKPKVR
jgi:hypothetical protein